MSNKTRNIIIIALSVLIVVCIGVTLWALFLRDTSEPSKPITPDYPPQGTEDNQKPIEGDDDTKLESPEGGGAVRVEFFPDATASLSEKTIRIIYKNPNASNQNVRVLVKVGETYIAKSELITPGHEIEQLALSDEALSLLQVGGYKAEIHIQFYDPETNEKAMVDSKGELTLTVTE